MRDLLEAIKQRGQNQTPFGHGIMTADRHVRNMQDFAGLDLCYRYASTQNMSFADAIKRASNTLVYSNEDMVVQEKAAGDTKLENIELPKNTLVVFKHVLTTPRKDRDGDVLRTEGAVVDPKMLLLWQHVHTLPIGKMLAVVEHNTKRLVLLSCIVDMNELAHDAAVMVDADMARFSHGFRALEFTELKETEGETTGYGFDVKRFEIMEESIVSVPSNADAEVQDVMLALVEGGKLKSPIMKEYGKSIRQQMPLLVAPGISLKQVEEPSNEEPAETTGELAAPEETETTPAKEAGEETTGAEVPEVVVETTTDSETQTTIEPKAVEPEEKAGRVLSAAVVKQLQLCADDLNSIVDTDKDMSRGSQAICERCVGRLQKVIDSASNDEGKEATFTVKDAITLILSAGSESDHSTLLSVLKTMETAKAKEAFVNDFMTVVGQ